jgi:hypothetical protein
VIEVHATSQGIEHFVLVPSAWSQVIENIMQSSVPSVRYELVELPFKVLAIGTEFRLSTHNRSLRVDPQSVSSKLLASLLPLSGDTAVVVQWLVTPHGPVSPPKITTKKDASPIWEALAAGVQDAEAVSALRTKYDYSLFLATPRIGIASEDIKEARHLLRRVEASWHETRAPGVNLQRRTVSAALVAKRMIERRAPLVAWPTTFNSQELSGLIGWPVEGVAVPGLALGGSRLVAASPLIPSTGTVIADSNFPGDPRPLAMDVESRLRHLHLLGPTGTGKSNEIAALAVQDMQAGLGIFVLDPKGDLCDLIATLVPPERRNDVIVLDPAERSDLPVVGLNPLHSVDQDHGEVVVENLVGLFKSLYRSSWGPRLEDVLRAALLTLSGVPGATLCEVVPLLTDPTYRRRVVGRLDDPAGLSGFWGWYESIGEAERQAAIAPVLNKLRAFTVRPRIRAIVGQSEPALNFRDVLAGRKILLVSLATGLLGEDASQLLGSLVIAELWNATLARAALAPSDRVPFMAHIDEWANFMHIPTPMADVLAAARGMGLGMTLAHQAMTQLTTEARDAVLANARSRVVFQLPSGDARLIARELGGVMTADDLQGLGAYEIAAQLFAAGSTQPVATGKTRPVGEPTSSAEAIREMSRTRYGVARAEVEKQIRDHQSTRIDAPTGRRLREGGAS